MLQLLAYMTVQLDVFVVDTVKLTIMDMFSLADVGVVSDSYTLAAPATETVSEFARTCYQNTFRVCDGTMYALGLTEVRRIRCVCI